MQRMKDVFLALGSNLGNRMDYLNRALEALKTDSKIKVLAQSNIYETEPVGGVPQKNYLNAVIKIQTSYTPKALLDKIHAIEKNLERTREVRWGPRTLDIDILLFGDRVVQTEDLIIPHKELMNRGFVLIPLADIAEDTCIPEQSLQVLIQKAEDRQGVKWYSSNWEEENK